MNWDDIKSNPATQKLALAKTRTVQENHPSIGAGVHKEMHKPYTFSRVFTKVII
jgi:hypothetical protein